MYCSVSRYLCRLPVPVHASDDVKEWSIFPQLALLDYGMFVWIQKQNLQ
jgi:hypothetical protein